MDQRERDATMSKKKVVKRYEWEDALIEAHAMGVLGRGDLFTALRLCHAITWVPKDGGGSALRWKNDTAAKVVGVGRATLYRAKGLKRHGYLIEHNKNLYPVIPESHSEIREAFVERRDKIKAEAKSQTETEESQTETTESHNETGKSQSDNPYSVDISPVDSSPVDVGTVTSVAPLPSGAAISDSHEPERTSDSDTSSEPTIDTSSEPLTTGTVDDSTSSEPTFPEPDINEAGTYGIEDFRKSQSETVGQPRDSSHLSGWDDEAATPSLRDQVVVRAGRDQMAEIDGLLEKIDADRERYAERLYDYALENNQFTQLVLAPVLMDWQKSDGTEVSKSLSLSMW